MIALLARGIAGAGVVAGAVVWGATRSVPVAVRTMLDLWLAAGLLRLGSDGPWDAIAAAAAVVLVRHLATLTLFTPPPGAPSSTGRA